MASAAQHALQTTSCVIWALIDTLHNEYDFLSWAIVKIDCKIKTALNPAHVEAEMWLCRCCASGVARESLLDW
jgi:hypothetical protein